MMKIQHTIFFLWAPVYVGCKPFAEPTFEQATYEKHSCLVSMPTSFKGWSQELEKNSKMQFYRRIKMFKIKEKVRRYYISVILKINAVSSFAYSVKIVTSTMFFLKCLVPTYNFGGQYLP
jgi:hypothetical protein